MANKRKNDPKRLVTIPEILVFILYLVALIILTYVFFVGFRKGIPSDRIPGGLEKSDWLCFWGSIIGVFGTTLIAWLSWKQNKTLNHINTEQERKRSEFSELELAATFYSSIFIERITISEDLIQIFMQSTGKVPPTVVHINSLSLYLGRKPDSQIIDAILRHEEHDTQYPVTCQQSIAGKNTYLIQLRHGHFLSNSARSEETKVDYNTKPNYRLHIDLFLTNPFSIHTVLIGDVVFYMNLEATEKGDKKTLIYDVFDSFVETKEYFYKENRE